MQGYILNIQKVKDEDLLVTLLCERQILTLYRFYGARHSQINLGYKIDFEAHYTNNSTLGQLRNVIHLGQNWNTKRTLMLAWQTFIKLLHTHLKEIEKPDAFYKQLCDNMNSTLHLQNPKRTIIEQYVRLLDYEGRLHVETKECFLCEESITTDFTLTRGFTPVHATCIHVPIFEALHVDELFKNYNSMFFDDTQLKRLWDIMCEGL